MAYSEKLADRVRAVFEGQAGLSERKMFGGLTFMVHGNMCCGVVGEELMVRVGKDAYEAALDRKHARSMDFTGRPMRGMVYVSAEGVKSKRELSGWVGRGLEFVEGLPKK